MIEGRVLLVSDQPETGGVWRYALSRIGLETTLVRSEAEAMKAWAGDRFDLILIDVTGPELDGLALIRHLRAEAANPILLFTGDRSERAVLLAYQAGVDECIVHPVSPALFVAKVQSWLRRAWQVPAGTLQTLRVGDVRLDPIHRQVVTGCGSTVKLTTLEFRLLHLLMANWGRVLPSDLIVERVWGFYGGGDQKLLKNLVYRLRRKIEPDPGHPAYIRTMASEGYTFDPQ